MNIYYKPPLCSTSSDPSTLCSPSYNFVATLALTPETVRTISGSIAFTEANDGNVVSITVTSDRNTPSNVIGYGNASDLNPAGLDATRGIPSVRTQRPFEDYMQLTLDLEDEWTKNFYYSLIHKINVYAYPSVY